MISSYLVGQNGPQFSQPLELLSCSASPSFGDGSPEECPLKEDLLQRSHIGLLRHRDRQSTQLARLRPPAKRRCPRRWIQNSESTETDFKSHCSQEKSTNESMCGCSQNFRDRRSKCERMALVISSAFNRSKVSATNSLI
jgi:hypothetical protein